MRFGIQLPQEGVAFADVLAHARHAEELGYDSVFIPDHLHAIASPPGSAAYEGWTTLTGVLMGTERIRGGLLVAAEGFRNPAWFANAIATLDHMSGGRLIVGMGAGWHEAEHRAYGYPWPGGGARVERLAECLALFEAVWDGKGFDGVHHRAEAMADMPRPSQRPRPPIWVGGQGPKLLEVAARHADAWNAPVLPPAEVAARAARLRAMCEALGRPMPSITYEGPVWIDEDAERVAARVARNAASDNPVARTYARTVVAGSPDQVVERVHAYAEAGVTEFVAHFGKTTDLRGTALFARTVLPAFAE